MAMTKEQIRKTVEDDVLALLRDVFGEDLVAVVLYGSVLRETFTPGVSDVNLLVIVTDGGRSRVLRLGEEGYRLIRRLRITPLVLSREEFTTSADVFPMEYLDMAETHEVLLGDDVTKELALSNANLRHEIEHQLRGSLVSLRQLAVASARRRLFRKRILRRELENWYGSIAAILRGLLRLKGVTVIPAAPEELVSTINTTLSLEPGPFLELLRCRENDCPDSITLIDALLERLSRLVEIVDRLDASGAPGEA
jgi:predicted nucleotidyltransferase